MTKDKTKKEINELQNVDSIKAVNIAMEINELQSKQLNKLLNLLNLDSNKNY